MKTRTRIPTWQDFQDFHVTTSETTWHKLPVNWTCPGCERAKFEVLHWCEKKVFLAGQDPAKSPTPWFACVLEHRDRSGQDRFEPQLVCIQCVAVDAYVRQRLGLPKTWTFSPREILRFVDPTPHERHRYDLVKAQKIYDRAQKVLWG